MDSSLWSSCDAGDSDDGTVASSHADRRSRRPGSDVLLRLLETPGVVVIHAVVVSDSRLRSLSDPRPQSDYYSSSW